MATTSNWDTDTSTGGKGFSRLWVKDGSTWDRANVMNVKVSGDWKPVRKVWTKVSGVWKPVMWVPEIDEEIYLGQLDFTSRDNQYAQGWGWFKYKGGDVTNSNSWETRAKVYQGSTGFSGPNPHDTGWVTGMASANANASHTMFKLPSPTEYDLTSAGSAWRSEYGACTPVMHVRGGHYSNKWCARACYDNTDLSKSSTVGSSSNPWGYTIS